MSCESLGGGHCWIFKLHRTEAYAALKSARINCNLFEFNFHARHGASPEINGFGVESILILICLKSVSTHTHTPNAEPIQREWLQLRNYDVDGTYWPPVLICGLNTEQTGTNSCHRGNQSSQLNRSWKAVLCCILGINHKCVERLSKWRMDKINAME